MTYHQAPDLQRVSWLERFAQKHKRGIRSLMEYAVIIFALFLAVLVLLPDQADSAPELTSAPARQSSTTQAVNAPVAPKSAQPQASGELSEAQEAVKEQVQAIAVEESYEAPRFLSRLAFCESSLNPSAKNPRSSALGLFQILDRHGVSDECRTDVECSTRWTIKQLKAGHASWWACAELIT